MVHGGGFCSGGGGGFSGGGGTFSAALFSTNFNHSRSRSNGSDCSDCSCSPFKSFCLAVTCISLKPRTRIFVVWFLVVFLSLTIGLSVGLGTYGKQYMETSSSDMRQILDGISPRMCSGVRVQSNSYPVSVFLLPDKPVVDSGNVTSHVYQKYAKFSGNQYEYWGFYLLEKSIVAMSICSADNFIDYYLIKGKKNLNKWKDNNLCTSCYEEHRTTTDCYFGRQNITHHIVTSDEYYFLFADLQYISTSVTVDFHLYRTSYDISNALHSYIDTFDSEVVYADDDTGQSVVVRMPDIDTDNIDISSTCVRRDLVFVMVFFIMPLGLGVVFMVVICFACMRKKTGNSSGSYSRFGNQQANRTLTEYSSFPQQTAPHVKRTTPPPSSYGSDLPPSYQEITRQPKQ